MQTTLQIPTDFSETTVLKNIDLDGVSFTIEMRYIYNILIGDKYYDAERDYWEFIFKDTNDNVLYREKAMVGIDIFKGINIAQKPLGILYFRRVPYDTNGSITKNEFIDKTVVLEYITNAEIQENDILR